MDGLGIVFIWLTIAFVGQAFSVILARRARRNRLRLDKEAPSVYRLMAWSIEVDAVFTLVLLAFMLTAGLVTVPVTLGYWPLWTEFIRTWITRPLIVAALGTTAIRLIVQYGFLKVIEERQAEYDDDATEK